MTGKTCVVTGGTSGIGAAAALELARRGAGVVIVGRSAERCEAAAAGIRSAAPGSSVEWLRADLSSQADVRRLAGELLERHPRLHALINNAGALFELRRESVDGVEMTLALNHLGPFLLTGLLLGALRAGAPSRVVVVSSSAHKDIPGFDFADPEARRPARWRGAYPESPGASLRYSLLKPWAHPAFLQYAHTKLANLLFTFELARRLAGTGVTANALHPGLVASGFAAQPGVYSWFMRRQAQFFGITPEEGARTAAYLAASPEVEGVTGAYFVKERPVESSPASRHEEAARRLWQLSERMTEMGAGAAAPPVSQTSTAHR